MGKLGGRELHYVSDLDVVFVHAPTGGADESEATKLALEIAGNVMRSLSDITAEGTAFEVDADLRPEGKNGPLSRSLASYETYWQRWAEPWEHQALLRARYVAGHEELGAALVEASTPYAYPAGDDGVLRRVLGALDGNPSVPRISAGGPLTDSLSPLAVGYRSNLRHLNSPSIAADGAVLATTFGGLPADADTAERYRWDVVDGSDRAQGIADAAADGEDEDLAGLYVSRDSQVVTASLFGSATTILGDGTVVVAAQDPGSGESIIVSFAGAVADLDE
jgi:hypothetical protein